MEWRFRSGRMRAVQRWSARHPYWDAAVFVPLAILNLLVWTDWSVAIVVLVSVAVWVVLLLPMVIWRQNTGRGIKVPAE